MDQQGTGRSRRADARRQPTWPPSEVAGPGPGPGPGPGTGAERIAGSGPYPVLGAGSGPYPALGAAADSAPTPPAGFPAAAEPPTGSFSAWHAPGEPLADPTAADTTDFYQSDDTFVFDQKAAPASAGAAAWPGAGASPGAAAASPGTAASVGAAAPPGAGPRADRRRGDRSRGRFRPRIAWIAAAVVVAAAAGFGGWKYLYEARANAPVPSTLRLPTTAPSDNGLDKTLGKFQHIGSRSQDPQPLTIAALFPPQFELNGKSYARTAASITKTCSLAVYGADLQAALQTGHCTQVARASYISGDGTMMGTVGVVNLISTSAAQKAGQATSTQEILAPLTGKKGPTSKLGNGTGVVQAEIKGHYLILVYAEYANLKSPSGTAQRQALEQFATTIITGSANINLSTRMLTGKQ